MSIEFLCKCQKKIRVPDSQAGAVVRCPACNIAIRIPELPRSTEDVYKQTSESSPKIKQVNFHKAGPKKQRRKKSNLSDTLIMAGICLVIGIGVLVFNQRQQAKNNETLEEIEQENETAKEVQEQKNSSPKKIDVVEKQPNKEDLKPSPEVIPDKKQAKMSEEVVFEIFYNSAGLFMPKEKASTIAKINFKKILVLPLGEKINLKIQLLYKNEGREKITWLYEHVSLKDSKGRIYEGKMKFDFENYGDKPGLFLSVEAGLSTENTVRFEMPRDSFNDDVYFGFGHSIQGNVLIFEKSSSTYNFSSEKEFKSEKWN